MHTLPEMNLGGDRKSAVDTTRRQYNQWVADESVEDYALRYSPSSFRKWAPGTLARTMIGTNSALSYEAIGALLLLDYGFTNAILALIFCGVLIFLASVPICHYSAKHNIDMDLLTRAAGFGYVGSTFTSLIYASFCFIFLAVESAIMAQALRLCFGIPLWLGYIICSVVVIPIVFYGVTAINRFHQWTHYLWLVLLIVPFYFVITREPQAWEYVLGIKGAVNGSNEFDLYHFGLAAGISFALIAQIGEQVDYLRFMPDIKERNKLGWWVSMLAGGPGWIVIAFTKQLGGVLLAAVAVMGGLAIAEAKEPIAFFNVAFGYAIENPTTTLLIGTLFVVVSEMKVNVTNAYAGSLAWSNFFSRVTHSHPGRVVWLIFNSMIALLLMELDLFEALNSVLGMYSNIAVAWICAVVADLAINKPLGLSPPIIEFKRAHLYDWNPVGALSMTIASIVSFAAYMGVLGPMAQAYSWLIAAAISVVLSPFFAWVTKGKYYIARTSQFHEHSDELVTCGVCLQQYAKTDSAHCPFLKTNICSLCCTLEANCHDMCKPQNKPAMEYYTEAVAWVLNFAFRKRVSERIASRVANFTFLWAVMLMAIGLTIVITLPAYSNLLPPESLAQVHSHLYRIFYTLAFLASVGTWWVVLVSESRTIAERSLTSAKEIAESATQAKGEFLANMSHEIRTPMNAVIGLNYLALKTEMRPKTRDYITKAHNAATSLLAILNDILDFSKVEAGKIEIESIDFNLESVLGNVSNVTSYKVSEKNLEFLFHTPPDLPVHLVGDPVRLGQVLTNLINNGIKFTEAGEICVGVEVVQREGDKILMKFSVRDSGIGMTQEQIGKLFQAFSQADGSITRRYGGTGLGLSISKRLVELMEGRIWVESTPGQGSTFIFTVWLRESPAAAEPRPTYPAALNGARVLVVDDNAAARDIMQAMLADIPLQIKAVTSGNEAVRAVKDAAALGKPFQLVFMDWKMPGMSGVEAAKAIKRDASYGKPPAVVMVTAFGQEEIRVAAAEAEVDAFLTKPVQHSALLEALNDIFEPKEVRSGPRILTPVTASLHGVRVLLGEDNPINQQIATELLEDAGVKVDVAGNGAEVVEILRKHEVSPYHAVLMDLQMPEMDGYEATRRIRSEPRFAKLPIIAMTAHAMAEVRQSCLDAGMNDHIVKPIDPAKLYAAVAQWCPQAIRPAGGVQTPAAETVAEAESAGSLLDELAISGINVQDGLARVAGRPATYLRILRQFCESQADSPEQIQQSLERQDHPTAERLAHTVKGVAGSIGAQSLYEKAANLEKALRRQAPHDEAFQAFRDELRRVIQALAAFLREIPIVEAAAGAPGRAAIAPELIHGLATLLREHDSDAVDYLLQNEQTFRAGMGDEKYRELEKAINDFDYKAATAALAPHVPEAPGAES